MTFRAVLLTQEDRTVSSEIAELDDSQLPEGNVTVDVSYSTLNYKDGMILTGVGRLFVITRMCQALIFRGSSAPLPTLDMPKEIESY